MNWGVASYPDCFMEPGILLESQFLLFPYHICVSLVIGTLSAYYGGIIDRIFVSFATLYGVPPIVIVLALIGGLGNRS